MENGGVYAVRLKQKSKTKRKKKIATAVYGYQADCDGEWGEIVFDFVSATAEIVRLADWDTMISNVFAKQVIRYLLDCENEKLQKETMFVFEMLQADPLFLRTAGLLMLTSQNLFPFLILYPSPNLFFIRPRMVLYLVGGQSAAPEKSFGETHGIASLLFINTGRAP